MARYDPFGSNPEHPFVNSSPDYAPRFPSRLRPIGDKLAVSSVSSVSSVKEPYRDTKLRLQALESERNQLLDKLIDELDLARGELAQVHKLHAETSAKQASNKELEAQLKQIEKIVDRNPYMTVLIDGNRIFFTQSLLQQGQPGGKHAAEQLYRLLTDFASRQMPDIPTLKLKLRMYANFDTLVGNLTDVSDSERVARVHDFVQGFNESDHLFDLTHAGSNKDKTEKKMIEQLRMDLYNCHCRHIILGGFCSTLYVKELHDILRIFDASTRLSMLDATSKSEPTTPTKLSIGTIKCDTIFRNLDTPSFADTSQNVKLNNLHLLAPALARVASSSTTSMRTPPASASSTPQLTWAGVTAQAVPRTVTPTMNTSGKTAAKTTPPKSGKRDAIEYNRAGQRIDKLDSAIPYFEVTRIKKMKLCNSYHLLGPSACTSTNCSHRHDYTIKDFERKVLREVARMTPCFKKSECDDPECIYGHRCPQSKENDKDCYWGKECRFRGWGHGIDTKVVKKV